MTMNLGYCEDRAREAAEQARDADLDNVRERALRSQEAWLAMAERLRGIEAARAERAEKALAAQAGIASSGAAGGDDGS